MCLLVGRSDDEFAKIPPTTYLAIYTKGCVLKYGKGITKGSTVIHILVCGYRSVTGHCMREDALLLLSEIAARFG